MKSILKTGVTIENTSDQIILAAHRGWSARYPENTLVSYRAALAEDIDEIELDIHLSRDGIPVLIHDYTVDRTTDGKGYVRDFTLDELKKLDAGIQKGDEFKGERIPTFEEFLQLIQAYPGLLLNVEIKEKTYETVDKAYALLERYGMTGRYVFCCFDANIVKYAKDRYNSKCQGFHGYKMANFEEGPGGTYSKLYSVGVESSLLTKETVKEFEAMGIKVWSYCPDTEEEVKRHLALHTRLMTCNDIAPAIKVLNEWKLR